MTAPTMDYRAFLEAKVAVAPSFGFDLEIERISRLLFPYQRDVTQWAIARGRAGLFLKFGLGKTLIQLEIARQVLKRHRDPRRGQFLIVAPLGVRQEFLTDARKLGIRLRFVRSDAEMTGPGVFITNYETIRDRKITSGGLMGISLDEGSVLRSLGAETFRALYRGFTDVPFRYVATATPAPNEYIEILNYAFFLGVMDIGEAKTRFFRRNSEKSDHLTLHPHKEREFWLWVATWAVFLQKPSELGYSDEGFELPPLTVNWHAVGVDHSTAGAEKDGQFRLVHDAALGLQQAAAAKRESLDQRVEKVAELVKGKPRHHVIVWHDLEDERGELERVFGDGIVTIYGSQDLDEREDYVAAFKEGRIRRLGAKPVMLGAGTNLQRHCHWAIFAGVGFKFHDFIQAVHRVWRYLQKNPVVIDIVFSEAEAEIVKGLKRKWKDHDAAMARMSEIIREFGLSGLKPAEQLQRTIGCDRRVVVTTEPHPNPEDEGSWRWKLVNNDTVDETRAMATHSIDGMIATSIPFSTQYEYTPSYNDFGHTDSKAHFFRQMSYLTPELYRVLMPGRVMCVHVKDRIRPGGYDGRSFQSVDPFHADCIRHYMRHGFVYAGMITIVTDVVRENNQTYRLGWTEQCKDGSRMGVGLPEYVLIFRKPPTDPSTGYADERVMKSKDEYTRGRWQLDAHAFWKSNGNRIVGPEDFVGMPWDAVFARFRALTIGLPYNHERCVKIAEAMDAAAQLPPDFMLLQPGSDHPDVWTDVARMRGLNSRQAARGREMHLCPLPFDICDRLINRFTNPGEVVFDPFVGIGTFSLRAVELGRRGRGHELNPEYFDDAVHYHREADERRSLPTLFDLVDQPSTTNWHPV